MWLLRFWFQKTASSWEKVTLVFLFWPRESLEASSSLSSWAKFNWKLALKNTHQCHCLKSMVEKGVILPKIGRRMKLSNFQRFWNSRTFALTLDILSYRSAPSIFPYFNWDYLDLGAWNRDFTIWIQNLDGWISIKWHDHLIIKLTILWE